MSDVELIERFNAAWLRGDLEAVLACLGDDVVYTPSGGDGPVAAYRGRDDVGAVFADQVGDDPDLILGPTAAGDGRAVVDWSYPTRPDGTTYRGVDVYTIRDSLIRAKDVYAKLTGPTS
jgi:ketosteroid isomerase-like protein